MQPLLVQLLGDNTVYREIEHVSMGGKLVCFAPESWPHGGIIYPASKVNPRVEGRMETGAS